jgi:hypothetical protein
MAGPARDQGENEKSGEGDMEAAKIPGVNGPENQNHYMKQAHKSRDQNNGAADEPGQLSLGSYLKVFDLIELDMDVFFILHNQPLLFHRVMSKGKSPQKSSPR